jgi:hypothetical protein
MLTVNSKIFEDEDAFMNKKNTQEIKKSKYKIGDGNEEAFIKSKECKDEFGNNTMHYAFAIHQEKMRQAILKVLLDNEIGDQDK